MGSGRWNRSIRDDVDAPGLSTPQRKAARGTPWLRRRRALVLCVLAPLAFLGTLSLAVLLAHAGAGIYGEEAAEAVDWVATRLAADGTRAPHAVSVFESTIRVLGGLLATAHLQRSAALLRPALAVGLRLLAAFDTPSGLPWPLVHLATLKGAWLHWTPSVLLADVGTLSLEFGYLAHVSGCEYIGAPAHRVFELLDAIPPAPGSSALLPVFIRPATRANATSVFQGRQRTVGGLGDSYYEYLLKYWIWRGKRREDEWLRARYVDAMRGVRSHLLRQTAAAGEEGGFLWVGEWSGKLNRAGPKMEHLVCFLPGLLALGHIHGVETGRPGDELKDLPLAEALMDSCYAMYEWTPTGLAPESVIFQMRPVNTTDGELRAENRDSVIEGGGIWQAHDARNLLRPEAAESLFVLYRATGATRHRERAWQVFRAFEAHARHAVSGYANLATVLKLPPRHDDRMESFFIAETLKYLLLIFEPPTVLPLTQYVFNTEAHALPILTGPAARRDSRWRLRHEGCPLDGVDANKQQAHPAGNVSDAATTWDPRLSHDRLLAALVWADEHPDLRKGTALA